MHPGHTHPTEKPQPNQETPQSIQAQLTLLLKDLAQKQLSLTEQDLKSLLAQKDVDRMLGCLFGAYIGDALGSYCEFQGKARCTDKANLMIKMPGGGPFELKAGQVTDDSEMGLHMLKGLLHYDRKTELGPQIPVLLTFIGKEYIQWVENIPFDIGFTCRAAITQLQKNLKDIDPKDITIDNTKPLSQNLEQAFKDVGIANQKSLSNGFMMRLAPMACFVSLINKYCKEDVKDLEELTKGENNMTHSNSVCINGSNLYLEVIKAMILRESHEEIMGTLEQIEKQFKNTAEENIIGSAIEDAFISQKKGGQNLYTADDRNAGFFKIALFYTFYCFRQLASCPTQTHLTPQLYKKLLRFTISQGGDTDTNACIAGGLIGAILGFRNLPTEYLVKQLGLRLGDSEFRVNEQMYEPRRGFVDLVKLILKFK